MDLWNRLFHVRKKQETSETCQPSNGEEKAEERPVAPSRRKGQLRKRTAREFNLSKDGIRVLLFRECERRGRKLLYDSSTVVRVPASAATTPPVAVASTVPLTTAPTRGMRPTPNMGYLPKQLSADSAVQLPSSGSRRGFSYVRNTSSKLSSASSGSLKPSGISSSTSVNRVSSSGSSTLSTRHQQESSSSRAHDSVVRVSSSDPCATAAAVRNRDEITMEISNNFAYQYREQARDSKQLGELVFGCVALAFRGSCSKLHSLSSPTRLMMSRTQPRPNQCIPPPRLNSDAGIGSSMSVLGSIDTGVSLYLGSNSSATGSSLFRGGGSSTDHQQQPQQLSRAELRRTSSGFNSDSSFAAPASSYFSASNAGSFLLSLPLTPFGSVSSKGSFGSNSSSGGSLCNLQRRYMRRTADTSLDSLAAAATQLTTQQQQQRRPSSSTYLTATASASASATGCSINPAAPASHSQTRLGLAVVLQPCQSDHNTRRDSSLQRWLLHHSAVLEESVSRLQAALDAAYLHTSCFVSLAYSATQAFQQELLDLLYGPHFMSPVWLRSLPIAVPVTASTSVHATTNNTDNGVTTTATTHNISNIINTADSDTSKIMGSGNSNGLEKQVLFRSFVSSLQLLLRDHDTKQTNFFISRLLTGVLTYHLGWVSCVSLREQDAAGIQQQTQGKESAVQSQVLELCGGIGYPRQLCRTVLTGAAPSLLHHCLNILSYFIRCQQVFEHDVSPSKCLQLFREEESYESCVEVQQNMYTCFDVLEDNGSEGNLVRLSTTSAGDALRSGKPVMKQERKSSTTTLCPSRNCSEATLRRQSDDSCSMDDSSSRACDESCVYCWPTAVHSKTVATEQGNNAHNTARTTRHTSAIAASVNKQKRTVATNTEVGCLFCKLECDRLSENKSERINEVSESSLSSIDTRSRPSLIDASVSAKGIHVEVTSTDSNNKLLRSSFKSDHKRTIEVSKPSSPDKSVSLNITNNLLSEKRGEIGSAFRTRKTSSNLAAMDIDDSTFGSNQSDISLVDSDKGNVSSIKHSINCETEVFDDVFSSKQSRSNSRDVKENLYPCLKDMDEHRDTFGPSELQPEVIDAKVRTLCRTTPDRTFDRQTSIIEKKKPVVTSNTFNSSFGYGSRNYSEFGAIQILDADYSNGGCEYQWRTIYSTQTFEQKNIHESLQRTQKSSEVRVCGEVIKPEVEDGKKVIFIVGADEELDKPCAKSSTATVTGSKVKQPARFISCLPHPHDTRPIREARNVARAAAAAAAAAEEYNTYSNFYLRPDRAFSRCTSERKLRQHSSSSGGQHKRASSDPLAKQRRRSSTDAAARKTKSRAAKCVVVFADKSVQTEPEPHHCRHKQVPLPLVELSNADGRGCGVAESLLGGVLDHYSPVFVLHAVVNTDTNKTSTCTVHHQTTATTNTTSPQQSTMRGSFTSAADVSTFSRPVSPVPNTNNNSSSSALSFASSLFSTSPNRLFSSLSSRSSNLSNQSSHTTSSGSRSTWYKNVLGQTGGDSKRELLRSLKRDLGTDARYSNAAATRVAILADVDQWSVEVVTAGRASVAVGMSPLVASMTDALLQLVQLNAPPNMIIQCLEDKLSELYYKSHILANYLLGGTSFSGTTTTNSSSFGGNTDDCNERRFQGVNTSSLSALPTALGLDLNDLPLLLATASTHSPHLANMYGLAIR